MSIYVGNELYHYGTKGQKWGVRNYQNPDGSYTAKGQGRYNNAVSAKALGYKAFSKFSSATSKLHSGLNKITGGKVKTFGESAKIQKNLAGTFNRMADKAQKEANAKRDAKKAENHAASAASVARVLGNAVTGAAVNAGVQYLMSGHINKSYVIASAAIGAGMQTGAEVVAARNKKS